jgi:hypothetical protein
VEGDDHRQGLTKDTPDGGPRNKAGEAVEIVEEFEFGHRNSMTRIPPRGKGGFPGKHAVSAAAKAKNHPLENAKNRK